MRAEGRCSFSYSEQTVRSDDFTCSPIHSGETDFPFANRWEFRTVDGLLAVTEEEADPSLGIRCWATSFKNTADADSKQLTGLSDADLFLRYTRPYPELTPGTRRAKTVTLTRFRGSETGIEEYRVTEEELKPGEKVSFSADKGWSSDRTAPFFLLNCIDPEEEGEEGVMIGIGWSGQWTATFENTPEGVRFSCGGEEASFFLRPGESVRTASVLIAEYGNGARRSRFDGQNAFRAAIRARAKFARDGRFAECPLSVMTWGSVSTDVMLDHVKKLKELDLGVECFFIDAGWYGHCGTPTRDERDTPWFSETGSWCVNPVSHPDGLEDVAKAVSDAGMDLLLWLEPERATVTSDWYREHPDWFLSADRDYDDPYYSRESRLLDLGNPDARQAVYDLVSLLVRKLGLRVFRNDFNMPPLWFWRANDEPGRSGMTEIRYVNGLYRLWSDLLSAHPRLLIDNCAAGGRRIDPEILRYSIPFWRSDLQCFVNVDPDITQAQASGIQRLIPWSGTGINGPMEDVYGIRSCYSPALSVHSWWWSGDCPVEEADTPGIREIRRRFSEFKELRPLLSRDFYPLTEYSLSKSVWCVWQYSDPETGRGAVLAFRRSHSETVSMSFRLFGIDPDKLYRFRDSDTGEIRTVCGGDCLRDGFSVTIPGKRESRLWFYEPLP